MESVIRSDFRHTGRESCSIQRHQKPVEAVAFFEVEISHSMAYAFEYKEANTKKDRSISSTGVTSNETKAGFKAKMVGLFAAAALAMMMVGNPSA